MHFVRFEELGGGGGVIIEFIERSLADSLKKWIVSHLRMIVDHLRGVDGLFDEFLNVRL